MRAQSETQGQFHEAIYLTETMTRVALFADNPEFENTADQCLRGHRNITVGNDLYV